MSGSRTHQELEMKVEELKGEVALLEDRLKDSEETVKALLNASLSAGYILDTQGVILAVNERGTEGMGKPVSEMIGLSLWTLSPREVREKRRTIALEVMRSGRPRFFEDAAEGRCFENVIYPIHNAQGNVVKLAALGRDITEEKRSKLELQASEERFRELAELLPETIFEMDARGKLTFVNRQAFDQFGYTQEDFYRGLYGLDMIVPEDRERAGRNVCMILKGENLGLLEYTALRKDGSTFPALFLSNPVMVEGEPAGLRGFVIDITDRKKVEEALRDSEEKYRSVVENANEMILVMKGDRLHFANTRAMALSGYSAEELISMPFLNFIHPDDREMVFANHMKRLKGEPLPPVYSFRIVRKDGDIMWVDAGAVVLSWENEPATLAFLNDITEKRKLEEELHKTERLESIGILAGGIAHDFNNILAAILGNISLAKMELDNTPKACDLLEDAERASLRAKDLTQQLLTFSKGGEPIRKIACVTEIIQEASCFALMGSSVRPEFDIAEDLWVSEIDVGQINQVIHNVILNADQAMPEGGVIEVLAENVVIESIVALPLQPGRYIRISIKDQGIGIPQERISKIFDPYFTTKQKGSGLGLSTAYSIIKRHGGHITVESKMGVGTTFHIYIPASEQSIHKPPEEERRTIIGKGRVLIMDDEEMIRNLAGQMLGRLGYDAEAASDGAEAIEIYRKAKMSGEPFEGVILDLTVPGGMGGREAIQRLIEIDPEVRAIVSSGYSNDPIMSNFREYGFRGVVAKPYRFDEFGEVLHHVLKSAH